MYKLKKENISGISPIIIENAEKDNMLLNIEGASYQEETPTLETSSEIEAIGDNINLFDGEFLENKGYNQTTGVLEDNNITYCNKNYISIHTGKIMMQKENHIYQARFFFYDIDKNYLTNIVTNNELIDVPANACYANFQVGKNIISNFEGIKIEIHNHPTPYSQYEQGNIEIIHQNKNMLSNLPATQIINGVTFTNNEDGTFTVNGTATDITYIVLGNFTFDNEYYSLSGCPDGGSNTTYSQYIIVPTTGAGLVNDFGDGGTFINSNNVTGEVRLRIAKDYTCNNLVFKPQLEKNEKVTSFQKSEQQDIILPIQKPFYKVGDYADTFIKQNNKWYEQHYIKEVILTGDENYWYNSSNANTFLIHQPGTINTQLALCNYFPFVDSVTGKDILACDIAEIRESDFDFRFCLGSDTQYTTLNDWKSKVQELYNAGAPIKIYFVLSIPDLIECTEEQSNILNNFETFEGQNIITIDTFNNTNPNFLIDYTPKMTDEIKQAFTTNITKAYIIRTSDGFEINQDNYLKDYKLEELRFVPDNGFLGGTVARRLTLNFNNVDNQFNIQDEDLRLYAGVEYKGNDYYIDYGNFIVQKPETENTTDNTNATCLDYMCLLNATYNDEMTYPCTLGELAENVCSQAGLELATKTFRNSDFMVENNQFVNGETLRNVLNGIALSAFSWARIGQDNKVYIDFTIKQQEDISLNYDDYFNLTIASKPYGPINRIILRNSQIEGENVTVQDDESIAANGVHELVIADNPFAYTQEKREQLIEAGKEFYGFSYMPITSMDSIGYIFLDSNSLMKITDMQDKEFYAYVLNHTIDYNGTVLDSIESPALTETETKYTYNPEDSQRLKRTEIIVNKHEQTISSIIQEQDELGNRQNIIEQDLDSTTDTISKVNEDLTEQINQLRIDLDGLTQNVSQKGGDNIFSYAKEFWTGETDEDEANLDEYTDTEIQQNSVSGIGYMINQGISIQKVQVKNDTYTISFSYKKLIELATGYVLINGIRYDLTSTDWDEIIATINVDTNYVDFEIISDTANAFELFDLMGAIGNEKQIWSQNANETRTDTVKIGKGITVSSSSTNTIWKADSDGNRIINTDTNEVVAEFTDKGTVTKNLEVNNTAEIAGILIQEIDGQTWISSLL